MTTMIKQNQNYKRGKVILVLFPHSDLRTAKTRPVLIIQADNLQTGLDQYIVAMITGRIFRAEHPSRVTVRISNKEGKNSGLLSNSIVMCDNIATVKSSEIDRAIGTLPMENVDKALKYTFSL